MPNSSPPAFLPNATVAQVRPQSKGRKTFLVTPLIPNTSQ